VFASGTLAEDTRDRNSACHPKAAHRIEEAKTAEANFTDSSAQKGQNMIDKIIKTDEEWRQELTPEQYRVMRQKGTERAFTGAYYNNHEKGVYECAACGNALFSSDVKFDSGTGWPSYWEPVSKESVREEVDNSHGMRRVEAVCNRCGAHLGHVFEDGPKPTGLRYCMNSVALELKTK